MKRTFKLPMTVPERVTGIAYIPIHSFAIPLGLQIAFTVAGFELKAVNLTLAAYSISFLFILITSFKFLKNSFSDLFDNFISAMQSVALGIVVYFIANMAVAVVLSQIMDSIVNPNSQEIINEARLNPDAMLVVSVLFAPIVEETMFRGALFGSIRKRARAAAYAVSAIVFALYHLWPYLIYDFHATSLLYTLQYIPASLVLAWCFERGGSIWASIALHALINLIASVSIKWTF
ncbi:MAG: CPBP family intramembrane metalloprotease [Oscillospiraceae bacterium]|jgi:membrane protease YdiL (CAAX protease family)|nr:CPBP family intramembrane metalloprotease [Oscillospiraceae bacterium]